MRRDLAFAGGTVLGARYLFREKSREQIFGVHALQLRRNLLAAATSQHCQRTGGVPAPADIPHRRIKQSLTQQLPHAFRVQVVENLIERKTVCWAKREDDCVFGGGGLQFEVELAAKAFAQRESPAAIQAAAKGRVQHELHTAAIIEESFQHEIV